MRYGAGDISWRKDKPKEINEKTRTLLKQCRAFDTVREMKNDCFSPENRRWWSKKALKIGWILKWQAYENMYSSAVVRICPTNQFYTLVQPHQLSALNVNNRILKSIALTIREMKPGVTLAEVVCSFSSHQHYPQLTATLRSKGVKATHAMVCWCRHQIYCCWCLSLW